MVTVITVAATISRTVIGIWIISCLIRYGFGLRTPTNKWLILELKPFYIPCCVIAIMGSAVSGTLWTKVGLWPSAVTHLLQVIIWFIYKRFVDKDEDDRWKKRMKKVAGKVKALASGRLTVVPNGA